MDDPRIVMMERTGEVGGRAPEPWRGEVTIGLEWPVRVDSDPEVTSEEAAREWAGEYVARRLRRIGERHLWARDIVNNGPVSAVEDPE